MKYLNSYINKIIIIYHILIAQFEALRISFNMPLKSFIKSLACSNNWSENSGGKSNATFIKTYDEQFVFKALERSEFLMFHSFAP